MNLPFYRKADAIYKHTERRIKELLGSYYGLRDVAYLYQNIRMEGDYRINIRDIVIDRYH